MAISKTPIVSVVMVAYNSSDFVSKAIESVLSQETEYSYELLIGEDESTDGTRAICQDYQSRYPNKITLFLRSRKDVRATFGRPNGGYNWVETIKAAKGKYIAILDGDDFWKSTNKLQKQIEFLENNSDYAGGYHNTELQFHDGQKESSLYRDSLKSEMTAEDVISIDSPFHTSSFIFRTSTFKPIPSWVINIYSGDMALFFLVACKGKLKGFDNLLSVYLKHSGGVTHAKDSNLHKYVMLNRILMLTFFNEYSNGKYNRKITEIMDHHFYFLYSRYPQLKLKGLLRLNKNYFLSSLKRFFKKSN